MLSIYAKTITFCIFFTVFNVKNLCFQTSLKNKMSLHCESWGVTKLVRLLLLYCKGIEVSCVLFHFYVAVIIFFSYAKAAFCLEELMMANPHNHLYCQQYAEVSILLKNQLCLNTYSVFFFLLLKQ